MPLLTDHFSQCRSYACPAHLPNGSSCLRTVHGLLRIRMVAVRREKGGGGEGGATQDHLNLKLKSSGMWGYLTSTGAFQLLFVSSATDHRSQCHLHGSDACSPNGSPCLGTAHGLCVMPLAAVRRRRREGLGGGGGGGGACNLTLYLESSGMWAIRPAGSLTSARHLIDGPPQPMLCV